MKSTHHLHAGSDEIYVFYPRGVQTGGPEALHQLVDSLRRQGKSAFLVPIPGSESSPRVTAYEGYDCPEATAVPDLVNVSVVVPEISLDILGDFKNVTKYCWWLSIDFSPVFQFKKQKLIFPKPAGIARIKYEIRQARSFIYQLRPRKKLLRSVNHLCQSSYAWNQIFTAFNCVPTLLSDYTVYEDGQLISKSKYNDRGRTIAYNPKKGKLLIDLIKNSAGEIDWIPLEGFSHKELLDILGNSAIYLDLGNHPGKDRLPREAALMGAIVIVAIKGSAAYSKDLPIPFQYKLPYDPGSICEESSKVINEILCNPILHFEKQENYRSQILLEKKFFDREVKNIFINGIVGFDFSGGPAIEDDESD